MVLRKQRVRPKLTITVSPETAAFWDEMIHKGKSRHAGECADIVTNDFRLNNPGAGVNGNAQILQAKFEEKTAALKQEIIDMVASVLEDRLPELMELKTIVESAPETPVREETPTLTFDELLAKCPSRDENAVKAWAEGWEDEITTSGHTVDDFVQAKLAKLESSAPVNNVDKDKTLVRNIGWRMVEMWVKRNEKGFRDEDTLKHHVAFEATKLRDRLKDIDNGSGGRLWDEVRANLVKEAEQRKWDSNALLIEWENIYYDSEGVVQRQVERAREEKGL